MTPDFARHMRAAAPYIRAHRGRICVIHLPGEAIFQRDVASVVYDLAVAHSLGLRLILVLGARPQIEARLAQRGHTTPLVGDLRVTDATALECVTEAAGCLRAEFEALLSTALASTPLGGARLRVVSGNLVTARPVGIRDGVDLQYTGVVRRVDCESLRDHLDHDRIVILPALGYSPTGEIFNLRAEEVAASVAVALGADKLVSLVADQAIERGELDLDEALARLGEQAWAAWALEACRKGVTRVHMLDAGDDGALLRELYTRDGAGLLVTAEDYDSLRAASIEDVGGILQLIAPLETEGVLVPRSREQLELEIDCFRVLQRDGAIIGCCALFLQADGNSAELACLAVDPAYRHGGRAARLLERIETDARQAGVGQLFVLTTHAAHWFVEHGFCPATLDSLPGRRRDYYNYQRNSQVLVKALA